jgi:hypothetical protein
MRIRNIDLGCNRRHLQTSNWLSLELAEAVNIHKYIRILPQVDKFTSFLFLYCIIITYIIADIQYALFLAYQLPVPFEYYPVSMWRRCSYLSRSC